ncbi:glycosyltransferase family 2 protein [Vallitalea sp.]|jgi:GT2 family glycosyltransferase|uniref:glycosyltransferase family 2 protein n=1 Tax=Vallitalea sp. TaxID=1882829 RepID=UPI0025CB941C|nr:glycosyltransferase [Vallitalea sp.]MCT4686671.1 glycosyltransferase [Vallitalea sp.]
MPYYSFIILCHNNNELTKQAIETLINSLEITFIDRGIEIIVVDNGSIDSTELVVKNIISSNTKQKIEIIYIRLIENRGYPVGINIGLSHCRGEIIGVLNNDLIFPVNWFNGLVEVLENNQIIGVAAPYLSYAYGIQGTDVRFNSIDEINVFSKEFISKNKGNITYITRVIGACMIIKRQVLQEVGGNDFFFGIGHFDDDDWCLRIRIAGYKIAVVGSSFVYHIGSKTFKTIKEDINHFVSINRSKFYRKWKLSKDRNINSVYIDREEYIKKNPYVRDRDYIPSSYTRYQICDNSNLDKKGNKILFIADWENEYSKWKEKLEKTINNHEYNRIYLWIPSNYYNFHNVVSSIKMNTLRKFNSDNINNVIYINENIRHRDILGFINEFDDIVQIEEDFVNKYIVYLANKLRKKIYL